MVEINLQQVIELQSISNLPNSVEAFDISNKLLLQIRKHSL